MSEAEPIIFQPGGVVETCIQSKDFHCFLLATTIMIIAAIIIVITAAILFPPNRPQ